MSTIVHDDKIHQTTVNTAESVRQVEVDTAIKAGGSSATVAAAVKAADIKFHRAAVASCLARGVQSDPFRAALHELGTGGF